MSWDQPSQSIREIVVEVLADQRRGIRTSETQTPIPSANNSNEESIRRAIRVLFEQPGVELTEDDFTRIIHEIKSEAEECADPTGVHLNLIASRLESIGCTTREAIVDYFTAGDRVLSELHMELRLQRPSPTRVRQLSAQFALDPRRRVDAPAHQIVIRNNGSEYEVGIVPPGAAQLSSIPFLGTTVSDPFARRIVELVVMEPLPHRELMQLIEMLLGYVPTVAEAARQLARITPATAVQVDLAESCIVAFGRCYVVDLQLLRFMQALLESPGAWVSSTQLEEDPLFRGVRIDRLTSTLPVTLRNLVESRPRRGYRLRTEELERICQISSIVPESPIEDDG